MDDIQFNRRTVLKLAGAAALTSGFSVTAAAEAQLGAGFEVEGPIDSITGSGSTGTISAMGMTMRVTGTSVLTSPSGYVLTLDEASGAPLPGRSEQGFVGGTIKGGGIIHSLDEGTGAIDLEITSAILEPAENVVFGMVTDNTGGVLHVNGVPFHPITDSRMLFPGYTDASGASLSPAEIPIGTVASGEGYYAGGALNIFTAELDFVADTSDGDAHTVSIARAEYRPDKNELRARGAASNAGFEVTLAAVAPATLSGNVPTVGVDPVDNSWSIDTEGVTLEGDNPEIVALLLDNNGAVAAESDPFAVVVDN